MAPVALRMVVRSLLAAVAVGVVGILAYRMLQEDDGQCESCVDGRIMTPGGSLLIL